MLPNSQKREATRKNFSCMNSHEKAQLVLAMCAGLWLLATLIISIYVRNAEILLMEAPIVASIVTYYFHNEQRAGRSQGQTKTLRGDGRDRRKARKEQ